MNIQGVSKKGIPFEIKPLLEFLKALLITMLNPLINNLTIMSWEIIIVDKANALFTRSYQISRQH
jgi:hypothetical protein